MCPDTNSTSMVVEACVVTAATSSGVSPSGQAAMMLVIPEEGLELGIAAKPGKGALAV